MFWIIAGFIVWGVINNVAGWVACAILSMNTRTKERTCAWGHDTKTWYSSACGFRIIKWPGLIYCPQCGLIIEDKGEAEDE